MTYKVTNLPPRKKVDITELGCTFLVTAVVVGGILAALGGECFGGGQESARQVVTETMELPNPLAQKRQTEFFVPNPLDPSQWEGQAPPRKELPISTIEGDVVMSAPNQERPIIIIRAWNEREFIFEAPLRTRVLYKGQSWQLAEPDSDFLRRIVLNPLDKVRIRYREERKASEPAAPNTIPYLGQVEEIEVLFFREPRQYRDDTGAEVEKKLLPPGAVFDPSTSPRQQE